MAKKEKKERDLVINKKIPTGSDLLDIPMQGGWDVGGMAQVYAGKSTGKSFVAMRLIYEAIIKYGSKKVKYRYNNAEATPLFPVEDMYGFTLKEEDGTLVYEPTIEAVKVDLLNFANSIDPDKDEIGIYIIDSQDVLKSLGDSAITEEQNKAYKKTGEVGSIGTYGTRAKMLGEMFRENIIPCFKHNVHVFVISQVRSNMNKKSPWDKDTTVSGGFMAGFATSKGFELKSVCRLGDKGREWGFRVVFILEKTRTCFQGRRVFIDFDNEYGIDNVRTNLIFAYDLLEDSGKDSVSRMSAIAWEDNYDPEKDYSGGGLTTEDYKSFCEELNISDNIREKYSTLRVNNIKKYISENDEIMKVFAERYGVLSFDDLILYIEQNNLEEELKRRVKLKWDYLENKNKPKGRKGLKKITM